MAKPEQLAFLNKSPFRLIYVLFCFAKKERATGAPKTMTAVFGCFFGELLYKEVKGSGACPSP